MSVAAWAVRAQHDDIPFKRKGRDRSGLDCWGLVRLLYREVYGVELPDYGDLYEPGDVYKADLIRLLIEQRLDTWHLVEDGCEREGDGIFVHGGDVFPHVGVVVRPGTMVHVEEGIAVSIVPYRNAIWQRPGVHFEFRRYRPPGGEQQPLRTD